MGSRQWHSEIGDSMCAREKPCQYGRMRSVGDRAGRKGLCEANSVFCQAVECGCLDLGIPVAVNVVSAKGINRNQENVELRCPLVCWSLWENGRRENAAHDCDPNHLHGVRD